MTFDDLRDASAWRRLPLRPGWRIRDAAYDPDWRGEAHGCALRITDGLDQMTQIEWIASAPDGRERRGALWGPDHATPDEALDAAMRATEDAAAEIGRRS